MNLPISRLAALILKIISYHTGILAIRQVSFLCDMILSINKILTAINVNMFLKLNQSSLDNLQHEHSSSSPFDMIYMI
jgi:hypothetical protein